MKAEKIFRIFRNILNHRWVLIVSAAICITVTAVAIHIFSVKLYSSPALLGLASGLGAIAAIWLTYSLARPK